MPRRPEIGPPDLRTEEQPLRELLEHPEATGDRRSWARVSHLGLGSSRVVRATGAKGVLHGALTMLPMAQYFGGRHVPVMALAGLGVAPQAPPDKPGQLLRQVLVEAQSQGFAAACVQPIRQGPWRDAGFEQAGARYRVRVQPDAVHLADHTLPIQRILASHMGAVIACYQRHAQALNGHFVRHPWCWHTIQNPANTDNPVQTYLISGDRGVEGYIYMVQRESVDRRTTLEVTDMAALTAEAGRRILTLLSDNTSLADEICWYGSPSDGICMLLPERTFSITIDNYWFIRIVDVAAALTRRGYPRGVAAELHLHIDDPIIAGNSGRKVLRVLDGRGTLENGAGRGSLQVTPRGLAALFTGHRAPTTLRAAGLIDGTDDELALAQTVFGGSDPWHPDVL